jgi:ketosteroid isomerase-like protein
MKTLKIYALAVVIGLLTSCNKPAEQAASTFDLEKAKAAINELHQKFSDVISKGDSVGFASVYHSQAAIYAPNMEPIMGKEKLVSFANLNFKMGVGGVTLQTTDVWGDPNDIVVCGTYEVLGKDGKSLDKGKYIEIWKDENGELKMFRDMWNTSTPMPAPAPEKKK